MQRKKVKIENLFFDPNNFRYDDDFDSQDIALEDTMKPNIQNGIRKK